jgi:hypothetical protein
MAKRFACWTILCALLCTAQAGELIPSLVIKNKAYRDVHWGPVNQGKVIMFHSLGMLIVPLADLPIAYQGQFGYTPTTNPEPQLIATTPLSPPLSDPPPALTSAPRLTPIQKLPPIQPPTSTRHSYTSGRDWQLYSEDRKTKVLFRGKLVDCKDLISLIGFIGTSGWIEEDSIRVNGVFLTIAELRDGTPNTPSSMTLRPNLWKKTEAIVLLENFKPETGPDVLVRLYGLETRTVGDYHIFQVATEPTFEQWQKLRAFPSATLKR